MFPTSRIRGTRSEAVSIRRIADIPATEEFATRRTLDRRFWWEFGFTDSPVRPQLAGCRKALNVITGQSDRVVLPLPDRLPIPRTPVPPPGAVPRGFRRPGSLSARALGDRAHRRL